MTVATASCHQMEYHGVYKESDTNCHISDVQHYCAIHHKTKLFQMPDRIVNLDKGDNRVTIPVFFRQVNYRDMLSTWINFWN